jgi:hypothetical protein
MRSAFQGVLNSSKIEAANAAGAGHVILERPTNVTNDAQGARVLFATSNFANYTDIPLVADFIMDPIPVSYLAAGRLKFMSDSATQGTGTIFWSLSWGGSGYTGPNTGATDNDDSPTATGDFGPPVNIALPSTTLQSLRFKNAATALSTSNLADYELTAGASVWVNNAGTSFTLVAPPTGLLGDFNEDDVVDAADYVVWRKNETDNNPLPNDDGLLTQVERFDLWRANFGDTPGSGAGGSAPIPEPASWLMLVMSALVGTRRRRR